MSTIKQVAWLGINLKWLLLLCNKEGNDIINIVQIVSNDYHDRLKDLIIMEENEIWNMCHINAVGKNIGI